MKTCSCVIMKEMKGDGGTISSNGDPDQPDAQTKSALSFRMGRLLNGSYHRDRFVVRRDVRE
ncbi:hypothetical protein BACI349Y_620263 [Bacillus sp. 349Y]|nr:hypothetical protein BACI349Y_620263 [Bacillus sp. 349Y]